MRIEPESPGYLLDIGANVGSYTLANLGKYGRAVCVDASADMCDAMRARLPADRCEVVRALVSGDRSPEFFVTAPGISTCCGAPGAGLPAPCMTPGSASGRASGPAAR